MGGRRGLAAALLGIAVLTAGCGGRAEEPAPSPSTLDFETAPEAYDAVTAAYADGDCDTAAELVTGTDAGVEQFLQGCRDGTNVEQAKTLRADTELLPTSLDPLPTGVDEAVRLTAAFTDERGVATDYYPDMVRQDGRWKLWLPGDVAASPSASPTSSPTGSPSS